MGMRKITQKDREKIKEKFRNSRLGRNLFKFLYNYHGIWLLNALFAWEFCYFFILGTLQLTVYTPVPNILYGLILWHAYTHHLTDLLCFGIGYAILSIKMRNFIYPALWVGFIIGVTEYSWWISYIIAHFQTIMITAQWQRIYFSNELTAVYAVIIISYSIIKGFDKRDILWIGTLCIFFAGWILLGFPITYDFNGPTIYLHTLWVNGIEVAHWVYSFTMYFIIVNYKKLRVKLFR
jgi:hypothetical protein